MKPRTDVTATTALPEPAPTLLPLGSGASAPDAPGQLLQIEAMAYGGKGLARVDGKVFFVADAVEGDSVEAAVISDNGRYVEAQLQRLVTPSPLRGPALCPYAEHCGGCQWQGIPYAKQLEWKHGFVTSALTRIGKLDAATPVEMVAADDPYHYRNRVLMRAHISSGELRLGYFRRASRELVEVASCAIAAPKVDAMIAALRALPLAGFAAVKMRLEIQEILTPAADSIPKAKPQATMVNGVEPLPTVATTALAQQHGVTAAAKALAGTAGSSERCILITVYPGDGPQATMREFVQLVRGMPQVAWAGLVDELRSAPPFLYDVDQGRQFLTEPGQFQQVNKPLNHRLRALVTATVEERAPARLLDVCCGSGNLSLALANGERYIEGIEANRAAIAVAKRNSAENGLTGLNFLVGDSEKHLWKCDRGQEPFDLIILDPPRQGLYKGMVPLKNIAPETILYISCDPTTLARDLGYLCRNGEYELRRVVAFDFFPNTYHVETLAILHRRH